MNCSFYVNIYFYDKFEFLYTLKNCHKIVFPYNLLFFEL